jgi:putative ABC transport system permease protein
MIVAVRTSGDPGAMIEHVKQLIWSREPELALGWAGVLTETIRDRYDEPPLYAAVLGLFALIAVVLASLGVYGVLAYGVSTRIHEFGVHMAVGARRGAVLRLVLGTGWRLALVGVLAGLVVALGVMRFAASILYGVQPHDPAVYVGCALLMAFVATLAGTVPALRATRIDPVRALRSE